MSQAASCTVSLRNLNIGTSDFLDFIFNFAARQLFLQIFHILVEILLSRDESLLLAFYVANGSQNLNKRKSKNSKCIVLDLFVKPSYPYINS